MFQKGETQPLAQASACALSSVSVPLTQADACKGGRHKRTLAPVCAFGGLPTEILRFKKPKPVIGRYFGTGA